MNKAQSSHIGWPPVKGVYRPSGRRDANRELNDDGDAEDDALKNCL